MDDEELKKLLVANQQTLSELREYLAGIHHQMVWNHVLSIIKIVVIVVPIILSVYFLKPLMQQLLGGYTGVMNVANQAQREAAASQDTAAESGTGARQGGQPKSLQEILGGLNIGK